MVISPKRFETGSAGFMWENISADTVFSNIRLHVYYAYEMETDEKWAGDQFVNHYNRLYYVKSGHAVLKFKGFELEMRQGCLYLLPPYTLDSHYCSEHLHFYWTHFHALIDGDLDFIALFGDPAEHKVEAPKAVELAFKKLVDAVAEPKPEETLMRNMLLAELLQPFFTKINTNTQGHRHSNYLRFLPILKLIENNLDKSLSIAMLAETMGVSVEHFSRSFKEEFNIPPKRYILHKKLGLAKQLLILGNASINDISLQCGFCDMYHFSKTFKLEEKCSPSHYRERYALV